MTARPLVIVYASTSHVLFYLAERPLEPPRRIAPGTDISEQKWLQTLHGHRTLLVIDQREESLPDTVPRLAYRDRLSVLERAMQRHFPNTRWRTAHLEITDGGAAVDQPVLYSALTDPVFVGECVNLIAANGLVLEGIITPSFLLPRLADTVFGGGKCLVVLPMDHGGLREVFLDGNRVRFHRVTLPDARVTAEEEISHLYSYLVKQRLLPSGELLKVFIVSSEIATSEAATARECSPASSQKTRIFRLQYQDLVRSSRLREGLDKDDASHLGPDCYARLALNPVVNIYATPLDLLHWKRQRLVQQASWFLAVLLVATTGSVPLLHRHVQELQSRYLHIVNNLAKVSASPGGDDHFRREAVQLYRHTWRDRPNVLTALPILSNSLELLPVVTLDRLLWLDTGSLARGDSGHNGATAPVPGALDADAEQCLKRTRQSVSGARSAPGLIIFSGSIAAGAAKVREAVVALDGLKRRVEKTQGTTLQWLQHPLDLNANGRFESASASGALPLTGCMVVARIGSSADNTSVHPSSRHEPAPIGGAS